MVLTIVGDRAEWGVVVMGKSGLEGGRSGSVNVLAETSGKSRRGFEVFSHFPEEGRIQGLGPNRGGLDGCIVHAYTCGEGTCRLSAF